MLNSITVLVDCINHKIDGSQERFSSYESCVLCFQCFHITVSIFLEGIKELEDERSSLQTQAEHYTEQVCLTFKSLNLPFDFVNLGNILVTNLNGTTWYILVLLIGLRNLSLSYLNVLLFLTI